MRGSPGAGWEKRRTKELIDIQLSVFFAACEQPRNLVAKSNEGIPGNVALGIACAEYAYNRELNNARSGESGFPFGRSLAAFPFEKSLAILLHRIAEPGRIFAVRDGRIAGFVAERLLRRKGWRSDLLEDEWVELIEQALGKPEAMTDDQVVDSLAQAIEENWHPTGDADPEAYRDIHEWAKPYAWYADLMKRLE